jgi:phosphoribosyl-ATP pyrophosphohydrolase/phosphoribosyl-AMP cyclohydrolase
VDVSTDCDCDALLVLADPIGPTCHKGTESCFADAMPSDAQRLGFLALLENIIANRIADQPESSYTAKLYAKGTGRIAQKVGEEGVETALAAVSRDDEGLVSECADLLFHLMVLLKSRELTLERIVEELKARHASKG